VRAGLGLGRELDRPLARDLARELRRTAALRAAARALRVRDHTAASLEARLERRAVPAAARRGAVQALEAAGIVDDARFAASRAEALAARAWGDAAVRADLERHGVAERLAVQAVAELPPERERAEAVVVRRGTGPRTARYLAARGFDPDVAAEAAGVGVAAEE